MEVTYNPILHVEDDENDIVLVQRALAAAGVSHPLQVVRSGVRAIDYLLGHEPFERRELYPPPSLILLGLHLPMLNGLEFLRWRLMRPNVQRIPVLMLTSSRQPSDLAGAYAAGANGYLVKPPAFDGLVEMAKAIRMFWLTHNTYATQPEDGADTRFRVLPTAGERHEAAAAIGL